MKLVMSPLARALLLVAVIGGLGLGMYALFSNAPQDERALEQASLINTTIPEPEKESSTATSTPSETQSEADPQPEEEPDLNAFEGLEDELDDIPLEWDN